MRALLLLAFVPLFLYPLSAAAEEKGPERWETKIKEIEARYATTPAPAQPLLFVGSSSILLWDLESSFPGMKALNHGFGGSTMPELLYYFDRLVTPFAPRGIVLYSGDNDIAREHAPEEVAKNYGLFLDRVRALWPACPVIVLSIKPSELRWEFIDKARAANALIAKRYAADPHCTYVDTEALLLTPEGKPDATLFGKDRLHLNEAGYAKWRAALMPLLEKIPEIGAAE